MKKTKTLAIFLFSGAVLLSAVLLSLVSGKYQLSLGALLSGDEQQIRVFLTLRLPRTLMALVSGFALGAAGMYIRPFSRIPWLLRI